MHEVGHTLGLRHNFKASTMLANKDLHNTEVTRKRGLVGSVMDYTPANIAPKGQTQGDYFTTTLGPYDYWAIEYAYKPVSGGSDGEKAELDKIAKKVATPGAGVRHRRRPVRLGGPVHQPVGPGPRPAPVRQGPHQAGREPAAQAGRLGGGQGGELRPAADGLRHDPRPVRRRRLPGQQVRRRHGRQPGPPGRPGRPRPARPRRRGQAAGGAGLPEGGHPDRQAVPVPAGAAPQAGPGEVVPLGQLRPVLRRRRRVPGERAGAGHPADRPRRAAERRHPEPAAEPGPHGQDGGQAADRVRGCSGRSPTACSPT